MSRTAVVAGATGLVGSELVKLLLDSPDYDRIVVLARRSVDPEHPHLEQIIVDFDKLEELPGGLFKGADLYCTLGTTMKKAGSREAFKRVDYDYPLALGRLAKRHGASAMLIVTAMGSSTGSMFYYSRVKGEAERDLIGLELPLLRIFRPSLIIGDRQEHRAGEQLAAAVAERMRFLFAGPLARYKPNHARSIAKAMSRAAQMQEHAPAAVKIYPSWEIAELAGD